MRRIWICGGKLKMWNATRWACFLALLGTTMLTDAGHRHRRMSCSAPACSGPSCFGPSCFGPGCYGPSCFGPACSGPVCSGPACYSPSCFQPMCYAPSCAASCFGGCAAPVDWSQTSYGYGAGYAPQMAWQGATGPNYGFEGSYGWAQPTAPMYQVPTGPMSHEVGWSTAATYHAPMPPVMRPAPMAPASDLVW